MNRANLITAAVVVTAAAVCWQPLAAWFMIGAREAAEPASAAGPFLIDSELTGTAMVGDNRLRFSVRGGGVPIEGAQLTATAVLPATATAPEQRRPVAIEERGSGAYSALVPLDAAGAWQVKLAVQTVDGRHGEAGWRLRTGKPGLAAEPSTAPEAVAYHTCAMHPLVRSRAPGSCPLCGMPLVAVTNIEITSGIVRVDAGRRQAIGVKTETLHSRELVRTIRAAGVVGYDESRLRDLTLRFSGQIGELFADAPGKAVTAGAPLFTINSPELAAAQGEYLAVVRNGGSDHADRLAAAARAKLLRLGLGEAQILELETRGTVPEFQAIPAPLTGTVIEKNIVAGGRVEIGMKALRIADLSAVWVEAALYDQELPLVRPGQAVEIQLDQVPGERIAGTIAFVYPYLDDASRTGKVRIALDNKDGRLRPGMYATAALRIPLGQRLAVPDDAVIYSGDQRIVFVDLGEGMLKPLAVGVGLRSDGWVEIRDGLKEGDVVVTSGVFLLASESRIKSGTGKW